MIENKRFTQIDVPSDIIDTKTGKIYHTMTGNDGKDLCILLNNLYEEIQALNKENKELEEFRYYVFKKMDELRDEKLKALKKELR